MFSLIFSGHISSLHMKTGKVVSNYKLYPQVVFQDTRFTTGCLKSCKFNELHVVVWSVLYKYIIHRCLITEDLLIYYQRCKSCWQLQCTDFDNSNNDNASKKLSSRAEDIVLYFHFCQQYLNICNNVFCHSWISGLKLSTLCL